MIKAGDADGEVAGADNFTGDVLRPAFQYVKTLPGISVVSGAFIMTVQDKSFGENGMMVFADCAVHPNPTAEELAQIAVCTGKTTRAIAGFEPKIAMLSFSTKGSAKHEMVDKVVEATRLAKEMDPSLANCNLMLLSFRQLLRRRRPKVKSQVMQTCWCSRLSKQVTSLTNWFNVWVTLRLQVLCCKVWLLRLTTCQEVAQSTIS